MFCVRRPVWADSVVSLTRRGLAGLVGVAVLILGLSNSSPANAVVPPVRDTTSRSATVDALPTVQINGVVWTQVMIGNVVYAGGEFTAARPAGAPVGTDEVRRVNLLAYDITTGRLITRFVPGAFNGPVRALAVSTNKKTLYVGGGFTRVGGSARLRFAAIDTKTGAIRKQKPSFDGTINALAVNSKTVYAGGAFTAVNGTARARLAAIKASSGQLTGWRARADAYVYALVLTSGSKLLVVGGMFTKLNDTIASGSGAVSPTNGKTKSWKVNKVVKNGGRASAILSLATDGATVYGAGYTYGTGNFEGVYAASSKDGAVRWLQDCHGDTYGVAPIGDIVYSVGHAHYCSNIGGFPDTSDDSKLRKAWYRALAVSKASAGTVAKNGQTSSKTYTNFEGQPAPALLNWFPELSIGTYTGMGQAAWSIVGNGSYISLGGEFPKVNGTGQQGLVRMAIPAVAPNKVGPSGGSASLAVAAQQTDGRVAVSWNQLWDRDNLRLTYELRRNGVVIDKRAVSVPFWKRTTMTFIDAGATELGASPVTYQVKVRDPHGNTVTSSEVSVEPPAYENSGAAPVPASESPLLEPSSHPQTVPGRSEAAAPEPTEPPTRSP